MLNNPNRKPRRTTRYTLSLLAFTLMVMMGHANAGQPTAQEKMARAIVANSTLAPSQKSAAYREVKSAIYDAEPDSHATVQAVFEAINSDTHRSERVRINRATHIDSSGGGYDNCGGELFTEQSCDGAIGGAILGALLG